MSSTTQDISNCINAPFDPINQGDKTSLGNWSLCYNQHKNLLSLSVRIQPGTMLDTPSLVSTIDADGLKDMIEFLYQVNMRMQQAAKTSQKS